MAPRSINALLGIWLFLTAFLWPHSRAQLLNAWLSGVLALVFALTALDLAPRARYLNVGLGIWLIGSAVFLPNTNPTTLVNHVVIGIALACIALLRGFRQTTPRTH
ncbi:MAG TPA: hypothetical protein VH374_10180 [Polyangia bacterium]|jgi:uncharacterized membrane protein|nr:hypothetical protein [Polyangia bacterium]